MSSTKYGKDFAVPKDFPSVLKAFTREVLRSQPDNIYEFGASYFTEVLAERSAYFRSSTHRNGCCYEFRRPPPALRGGDTTLQVGI